MENIFISGFLLINKPAEITSTDCINKLKRLLPKKAKIGHAGTLDRFATGLLLVAIGRAATRQLTQLKECDKTYIFTMKFGQTTDTLDSTGIILEQQPIDHITQNLVEETLKSFGNEYLQIPPLYSALKYHGKRLSTLARSQQVDIQELEHIVQKKARTIILHGLVLEQFNLPYVTIRAHVSSGTYIRSLVRDIAEKMGTIAVTHQLQRTMIGKFDLKESIELNSLKSSEDLTQFLCNNSW
jgi:tRNA pseudouridine55 synthase